jgi:uncharacterized protein YhaN
MAADEPVKFEAEIPDRVWDLYFGPGGTIPRLEKTMNKLCSKLDATDTTLNQIREDMKKYNELRPEIKKWADEVVAHKRFCENVQAKKNTVEKTNAEWEAKIEAERMRARDEAWHQFKVVTTVIGLILAGLGFLIGKVWPMFF